MRNARDQVIKRQPNWTPNTEAWEHFLFLLHPDHDSAGVEYEKVRRKLLTLFRSRGCWDPEQCVDETIDRTIRRIDEVQSLHPFLLGVARRVASEVLRGRSRQLCVDDLNELAAPTSLLPDNAVRERQLDCLDRCLEALSPLDREFLLAYYCHEGGEKIRNKKVMANSFGIGRNNLRVRAFRLKGKLAEKFRTICPA